RKRKGNSQISSHEQAGSNPTCLQIGNSEASTDSGGNPVNRDLSLTDMLKTLSQFVRGSFRVAFVSTIRLQMSQFVCHPVAQPFFAKISVVVDEGRSPIPCIARPSLGAITSQLGPFVPE